MTSADEIREAIRAAGGEIPFETFMDLALYGEHGFYTRSEPGRAGRRGDFITSPEVGPLFGVVIARALDDWWDQLGRPASFTVVDAGAGPGTLARSVLAAAPRCAAALTWVAVETSAAQRELHPDGIVSTGEMPTTIDTGVIIANELLDNLPFELWVFDDGWRMAHVAADGDRFVEVLRTVGSPSVPSPTVSLPSTAPHGARVAVQTTARNWLRRALDSVGRGRVVVLDYAVATTAVMASTPWRDWLRTYAGHERGGHYLSQPGEQDITCDVVIEQLEDVREPDAVRTQAQFLSLHGLDDLVEEGRRHWEANAARPDLAAMRMRSRISEAGALLDPAGLGRFSVLEWQVG